MSRGAATPDRVRFEILAKIKPWRAEYFTSWRHYWFIIVSLIASTPLVKVNASGSKIETIDNRHLLVLHDCSNYRASTECCRSARSNFIMVILAMFNVAWVIMAVAWNQLILKLILSGCRLLKNAIRRRSLKIFILGWFRHEGYQNWRRRNHDPMSLSSNDLTIASTYL